MLDTLITSKTRVKMLLKFFLNGTSTSYLRSMAEEFGESTNAVRLELNKLTKAGILVSREEGRTIMYRANLEYPFYAELKQLVHKYLGIDKIIDQVLSRLGYLEAAFIVGDYARGRDTGQIEIVLVGNIKADYLKKLLAKAENIVGRKILYTTISSVEYHSTNERYNKAVQIWGNVEL